MTDFLEQYAQQARADGLDVEAHTFKVDGRIHRCNLTTENGKDDGSYCIYLGEPPRGWYQNHQNGHGAQRFERHGEPQMSYAERAQFWAQMEQQRAEREAEEQRRQDELRESNFQIWKRQAAALTHPYSSRKGVKIAGHRFRIYRGSLTLAGMACDGALLIPLYDAKQRLSSLQFVNPDGVKRFRGPTGGCYFPIGKESADSLLICEGAITGLSLHECTGLPVAAAMNCGNLAKVGRLMRERHPSVRLVFCADDDAKEQREAA